jgi:hypothetical protein
VKRDMVRSGAGGGGERRVREGEAPFWVDKHPV